jgi:hypothetical protein
MLSISALVVKAANKQTLLYSIWKHMPSYDRKHQPLSPLSSLFPGVKTIGFAMYYFTYDPRIGKLLHLEDFYITEDYQGKTIIIILLANM